MIAVPATPATTTAVTAGAISRIAARTKKPPSRSRAPKRLRTFAACRPGRAETDRYRRDQQREPAELQREEELADELLAVRIGGRIAEMIVRPVRSIISPTCSKNDLAGKNLLPIDAAASISSSGG